VKVVSIVGARPQFIKLAPVSRALRQWHDEVIVHTGQHYDVAMSSSFFEELAIPRPDVNLEIGSGSHGEQTGRMLTEIERTLQDQKPDAVLVFGDTNSTLAGALAAAKLHIPVAHVEAGLRSFNRAMPEEINRVVTDHLSDRLYCPTETARAQAAAEGLTRGVEVVGDVMYDVLLQARQRVEERAQALLPALGVRAGKYILVTIHRASNTDDPAAMRRIASALNRSTLPVVFPVHPRTRKYLADYGIVWADHVRLSEPVGYLEMLALEQHAARIATDSGGVQKEAYLLGVPCVTLREDTEWVETLHDGWNVLAGSDAEAISAAFGQATPTVERRNPFGTGDAAHRIALSLRDWP
jgi:UDP-N-acetylglucosamine 2-epimerase (non-hydrolysing)